MVVDIRRLSVSDYYRLGATGIIDRDEAVELIDGQIFKKPVKGSAHEAAITRSDRALRNVLDNRALLRFQSSVRLNDYSEPEPDIAIVRFDPLYYEAAHPQAKDVFLLIEVADSSLDRDIDFKANVYARANIEEYWVIDLVHRQLHIFRHPSNPGYQQHTILDRDRTISLLAFPDVTIAVRDLVG